MCDEKFSKWVACWGNATSISEQKEAIYSKNITLRYPVKMCFYGNKLRFHFSNLTGTEPVEISKAVLADSSLETYKPVKITFEGKLKTVIQPGTEILSDEISFDVIKNHIIDVSLYLENYTQMNAGTLVTGPLSSGKFSYGDFSEEKELPLDLTRSTNVFYFLNTIDVFTEKQNYALICYGDSITAQSWPDYLKLRCEEENFENVAIIRRAVCGTRILREYKCITYAAYGLKGEKRFAIEMNTAGAKAVIIQHGINDIIHPVGIEVNPFRPWSDMPEAEDLIDGVKEIYLNHAKKLGLKVWSGTLLPIYGWRTYNQDRENVKNQFNSWLKSSKDFDGCIDFEKAVQNPEKPEAFKPGFDSGDHLHPSEQAYKAMAMAVPESLLSMKN